jgi:hypothetical protein
LSMWQRLFQVFVLTFLAIFTVGGIVLLSSAIASIGSSAGGGGMSFFVFSVPFGLFRVSMALAILFGVGVYLIGRRSKLR